MTIIDQKTVLSDAQALTGTSVFSDNVLDLQEGLNVFGGTAPTNYEDSINSFNFVNILLNKPLNAAGAITATVQDSADGTTFADTAAIGTIAAADSTVLGSHKRIALPQNLRRYVRLKYTGTALAGGIVTSWAGFGEY